MGGNHPNTLSVLNNLALLYDCQGRYNDAEDLFQKVLLKRREILGNNHYDTELSQDNYNTFLKEKNERNNMY